MAGFGEIARGNAEIGLYAYAAGVPSTAKVAVPGGQAVTWSVDQNSEDLDGEDTIIATAYDAKAGSGQMTWGKMILTALAVLVGGTVTVTGTGTAEIATHEETDGVPPQFQLSTQAVGMDADGSGYRVTFPRCRAQSPAEGLSQRAYNTPQVNFRFLPGAGGVLIRREQYETLVPLPSV